MKQKKQRDAEKTFCETSGTDTDDVYLPVCCGEFGLEQAAGLRALWEATWSQDRRGRGETSEEMTPTDDEQSQDTTDESSEG